jgi:hypothetical protein
MIFYCVSFFSFLLLKPKNLKLKTLLAFIIYNLTFNIAFGQTYPVQISTQLIPPYSGYLPDYADPTAQNLKVILQFNDFTVPSYNLKLKFEIKGNGFSLVTKSIYNPPPLSLQPGQPLLLSGIDIAPYLSSNNLDFIGINQSQYEQRMALPEGYYSICVKAYDYYSGSPVQVSNEACAQGWFTLSNPPLLNLPLCNNVVTPLQPQNLLFSWTPVNLGSPNSAFNTSYLFELWEMRPDSTVNPNQLVQNTQPIFSQATTFNNLNYGIADPPLNLYYKYAWRVRVIDGSGRDWFINNGFSQVCTFYYGSISNTLGNNNGINIQAEALDYTTGKATWTLQTIYNAYQFEVRKANIQNWFPYTTTSGSQQIDNLEPNNTYECRVKGFGNDFNSEYSNIVQFTTPNAPTYNCNQTAPIYSLNTTPLPINKALPGITLRSGQFDIKIKTIEPSTNGLGWYKGSGYALMFGLLPVPVTFSNVFIDDKLRHQQGLIEAVTQGIKNWMVQFDIEDAEDNATYTEGTLDSVYINGNQYCYTTIQNQTPVCTPLDTTNKITVIRDGDGNQYVVNAGPPPTVTGPTNYLNTSNDNLAASDTLKVEFIASPNQNFGFDGKEYAAFIEGYECIKLSNGKNYFVPNKSVGINQNDKVYANCTINNLVAANLSFKTFGGAILSKTSVNATVFEITNIPANANCIYAWYNNKKIGKLNVLSLNKVSKKVVLVSVNNASLSLGVSQMGAALNAIYKQANTNFTITTASNFTFNLGNDGLQEADATLLKKYSLEMRALRDAYKSANSNYDKNASYVFVVPNFSEPQLKGYMVRGRAVGFVKAGSNAKTLAHELAHGAFGLEHTFPSAKKASTNNLLDDANGIHLVKVQWEQIQNPGVIFNWLDEEEDGSSLNAACNFDISNKYVYAPNGKLFLAPANSKISQFSLGAYGVNGFVYDIEISGTSYHAKIPIRDYGVQDVVNEFEGYYNYYSKLQVNYLSSLPNGQYGHINILTNTAINLYKKLNAQALSGSTDSGYDLNAGSQITTLINGATILNSCNISVSNLTTLQQQLLNKYKNFSKKIETYIYEQGQLITILPSNKAYIRKFSATQFTNLKQQLKNGQLNNNEALLLEKTSQGFNISVNYGSAVSAKYGGQAAVDASELAFEKVFNDYLKNKVDLSLQHNQTDSQSFEDGKKISVKQSNIWDLVCNGIKATKEFIQDAEIKPSYWNNANPNYANNWLNTPPLLSGIGNGVIEEIKEIPQLVTMGAELATSSEARGKLWTSLKGLSLSKIKNAASSTLNNWTDTYAQGGDPAWHQGGKDGVMVFSMLTPIGFLKNVDDALSKNIDDAAKKVKKNGLKINPINIREVAQSWTGDKKVRFDMADEFYSNAGYTNYDNHLRGIDFDQAVDIVDISKTINLYQMVKIKPNGDLEDFGSYFFDNINEDITKIGIGDMEQIIKDKRVKVKITINENVQLLKSKAADIEDWNGGGKIFEGGGNQMFNNNIKSKIVNYEIIQ